MPAMPYKPDALGHALTIASLCVLLSACATPAGQFRSDASKRGFVLEDTSFGAQQLVVFRRGGVTPGAPVHFYLDGDGAPWLARRRVATDPTTRERLILEMMERDAAASVLIGRPCYYVEDNACDPSLWTVERYGNAVVEAMAAALNREIERLPGSSVTLIGYSGGGALAMLLAPRLVRVDHLLTVAANLDVAAWTRHHGHTPLRGSLDPADAPPLPRQIDQVHWFGERDDNVPSALMRHVALRQPNARWRVVPDFDHTCCWVEAWPELLREALADAPP